MSGEVIDLPLNELSREELLQEVLRLKAHVKQLRNILEKKNEVCRSNISKGRKFDFSRFNTRHVALKILYAGWDYDGLAVQEDTQQTIESVLFKAFNQTKLIESRETSNYHRCGRTDKGVSAFSQVISIDLRTNLSEGIGVKSKEGSSKIGSDDKEELNYVYMLNKVLPPDVRVLAWCPVHEGFSARFNCIRRTYKYIFPKANLNLKKMKEAANHLIGEKDFRNLCKMDVANGVVNFTRKIISVKLHPLHDELGQEHVEEDDGYEMYVLTIVGQAFLWHQIRCIVAILMAVGQGLEEVEVVEKLLDVQNYPQKPQYTMASEIPLVLYDCEYDGLEWRTDNDSQNEVLMSMQSLWSGYAIKSWMLRMMLCDLEKSSGPPVLGQIKAILPGNHSKVYKALFDRPKCESLESRISHYSGKRKRKFCRSPNLDNNNMLLES